MADFLLEIGTEEIPPLMVLPLLGELKEKTESKLKEKKINFKSVNTSGTGRRLILIVKEIALCQEDSCETFYGPPAKIAIGKDSNFTHAAISFAKKVNVPLEELKILDGPRGKAVGVVKEIKGKKSLEILSNELPKIIDSLYLPKSMKWGEGNYTFIRPVRWVLALIGNEVVDLEIKGVKSGKKTRGHRILSRKEIEIENSDEYFEKLRKEFVIADAEERKEKIVLEMNSFCEKIGGFWNDASEETEKLLETVTFLCEHPVTIMGDIPSEFISLPAPVLSTCLREHQKFFGVFKKQDNGAKVSLPFFIAISDGSEDLKDTVLDGLKNVTIARLVDAKFFFEHDKTLKLEKKLDDLKEIVFHPKIGSYYDKSRRMERYARELAPYFGVDPDLAARAALLSKCDLASLLVQEKEFTSLQGIAGGLYAEAQGEDYNVAKAIYEHYDPPVYPDRPTNPYSIIVCISDRADTLIEFFKIGEIPSGSKDPFGLRRAGKMVVDLLSNQDYYKENEKPQTNLQDIIFKWYGKENPQLIEFLKERFRSQIESETNDDGTPKYKYDEINAVLATPFNNLFDLKEKLFALNTVRSQYIDDFDALSIAFKRAKNILRNVPLFRLDPLKFLPEETKEGSAERALHKAYIQIKDVVESEIAKKNYIDALTTLSTLRPYVDRFFDDVLVMCDPEGKDPQKTAIQQNRLALLGRITKLFYEIADFSEIVPMSK